MKGSPLDEDLFSRDEGNSPNADILNELFSGNDFGNTCIFRVDGKTAIGVQSDSCHGIIDIRRIRDDGPEKCDPETDPTCKI